MFRKIITILALATFPVLVAGCTGAGMPTPLSDEHLESEATRDETHASGQASLEGTWLKRYGGGMDDHMFNIQPVEDGGFLVAGGTNLRFEAGISGDMYLFQTDSAGELLWEEIRQSDNYMTATAIFTTEEDGYLVSGVTPTPNGGQDVFLMLLDKDRNELWTKYFGGPLDEYGAVYPLSDGGYLVAGDIVDPNDFVVDPGVAGYGGYEGRSNVFITRVDADGEEIWTKTIGGENNVMSSSGIMTADGGFIILTTIMRYPDPEDDISLIKIDANGREVWSHTWEDGNLSGNQVIETSDGNFLIVGGFSPAGGDAASRETDFLFIKVDQEGDEVWQSIVGDPELMDWGFGVVEAPDGGYVAMGDLSVNLYGGGSDITLVKINPEGELIWQRTIDMNTHTMLASILRHQQGGYVIAGTTLLGSAFDILLIHTNEEGGVQK